MNGRTKNGFPSTIPSLDFFSPTRRWKEFCVLTVITDDPSLSQHRIAQRVGISHGMTNAYIKRFIETGHIRVTGETNRSIRYYLTPAGRRAKRVLLHRYGREVARLHTVARQEYRKRVAALADQGMKRVVVFGAATTGALVYEALKEAGVEVVAIVDNDPSKHGTPFGMLTVQPASAISTLTPDTIIIAAFGKPDEIYHQVKSLKQKGMDIVRI